MTKAPVLYYSTYGHVETMANAVAEGVADAGAEVVVKRTDPPDKPGMTAQVQAPDPERASRSSLTPRPG